MSDKTNKCVVIVMEQCNEEITVYEFENEDAAIKGMKEIWLRDVETEVNESCRNVDFTKSYCEKYSGELYYEGSNYPIKYFVGDISTLNIDNKNNTHVAHKVVVCSKELKVGDVLSSIEWKERDNVSCMAKNAKIIAIKGCEYMVCYSGGECLTKILFDDILSIDK